MSERSDAYEDRISHLRSGLRMAKDHIDNLHAATGIPPETFIGTLLGEDVDRSVAMDSLSDERKTDA